MPKTSPRGRHDRRTHSIFGWFDVSRSPNSMVNYRKESLRNLLGTSSAGRSHWGNTITIRTDHRNLLFMNQYGSRKVLQWKLDIQHYNAIIEHVPGKANIPADIFSRQIIRAPPYLYSTSLPYTAPQNCDNSFINIIHTFMLIMALSGLLLYSHNMNQS